MAGLLSSVGVLLKYVGNVQKEGIGKGTLKSLKDNELQLVAVDGSMLKLVDKYVVEPVVVVSDDLRDVEELDAILGVHMDLFTGYYMQVFGILRDLYGLDVNTIVDTLATDNGGLQRAILYGLGDRRVVSKESLVHDYLGEMMKAAGVDKVSTEAIHIDYSGGGGSIKGSSSMRDFANHADKIESSRREAAAKKEAKRMSRLSRDSTRKPLNLSGATKDLLIPNAMQRTIEVTVETVLNEPGDDGKYHTRTIVIPITIKLAVIFTSTFNLVESIASKGDDYTFSSRLDEYRAGAISLADFIFATDLVNKYKDRKLKGDDPLKMVTDGRVLSANSKMITNGFAGFEKYYNMYIISPEAKTSIESEIGGKLSSPKYKEKFLDASNGLSITIVDPDRERVNVQFKDIRGKTDLSFRGLIKNKDKGSDYSEIIKALVANKPPVF